MTNIERLYKIQELIGRVLETTKSEEAQQEAAGIERRVTDLIILLLDGE